MELLRLPSTIAIKRWLEGKMEKENTSPQISAQAVSE